MIENTKKFHKYYEYDCGLTLEQKKIIQDKIEYVKKLIPNDVKTIIDIGCGSGFITNQLAEDYKVIGVDINSNVVETINIIAVVKG